MKSKAPRQAPTGAIHSNLLGGTAKFRFRPQRLSTDELAYDMSCEFHSSGSPSGRVPVVDVSTCGLGVMPQNDMHLAPGSILENLSLYYRDHLVWSGEGTVIYQTSSPQNRIGLKLTSGIVDLQQLRLGDELIEKRLDQELFYHYRYSELLPVEWRAGVNMIRLLLERAKDTLDDIEESIRKGNWWRQQRSVRALCRMMFRKWGKHFIDQIETLDKQTRELEGDILEIARKYAAQELIPMLYPCPMHSRAFDKPLGYAGDYRLMTLYFAEELEGETFYARFLHYVAQHYSLGRTVIQRVSNMRLMTEQTCLNRSDRVRIVSLASGPALELQGLLRELRQFPQSLELILIDQDEESLEFAYESVNQALLERASENLPVKVQCLHFSVKQLLDPRDEAEKEVLSKYLQEVDLIYSAGLLDYLPQPIARNLLTTLYQLLGAGGRLYIGNLERVPDTSWIMEFVLAWHLQYRSEPMMLDLVQDLKPKPANLSVDRDQTGHCLFLDVQKN